MDWDGWYAISGRHSHKLYQAGLRRFIINNVQISKGETS